jgi:hypothetical protein
MVALVVVRVRCLLAASMVAEVLPLAPCSVQTGCAVMLMVGTGWCCEPAVAVGHLVVVDCLVVMVV